MTGRATRQQTTGRPAERDAAPRREAPAAPSLLAPAELAWCDALARDVDRGFAMAVRPVRWRETANRILEATHRLLHDRGFLVVVVDGGSDDALAIAWSSLAAARRDAARDDGLHPAVLIVRDAHLLAPGRLQLLAEMGGLPVVAAPVVPAGMLRKIAWRRGLRAASTLVGAVVVSLAAGLLLLSPALWPDLWDGEPPGFALDEAALSIGRRVSQGTGETPEAPATAIVAPNPAALAPPLPSAGGAPGLLLRAGPGDTLETLYRRVYRGVTPPPFAAIADLNPQPVAPGVILTFPEPAGGWVAGDAATAGPAVAEPLANTR